MEKGAVTMSEIPSIKCPNCGAANLEQHRRRPDLLVCSLCWHKYDKEEALKGKFVLVKKKIKSPRWAHPRWVWA
jgi:rubredoxin